ncbi:MAG TPA: hypothetical protein VEB22_00275, partial [Phycisphaerales bacterium]|nr:hypothetical protein [Phycisphaerales bacterium]
FPPKGKAVLIPHGMDQVFLDPNYDALGGANGMLAAAVLRNPEWNIAYRSELARVVERFDPASIAARVNAVQSRLQPAMAKVGRRAAALQAQRVREVLSRVGERARVVREQSSRPVPKPLEFLAGEASLVGGWEAGTWNETPDAGVSFVEIDGAVWGKIACGPSGRCVRSFRRTVLLGPGTYRLEAEASAEGLVPLQEPGAPGRGAGVRISGSTRGEGVTGTDRRMVTHTFTVDALRDVVLVVELRASAGAVAFRAGSMKLVRVTEPAATTP